MYLSKNYTCVVELNVSELAEPFNNKIRMTDECSSTAEVNKLQT